MAQPELPPPSDNAVSSPRFRKGFFQRRFLPAAVSSTKRLSGGFFQRRFLPAVPSNGWFSPAGQHPRATRGSNCYSMSDDEEEPGGLDAAFDRLLEPDPELGPREPIRVPLRRNRAVRLAELAARFAARVRQRARVPPVIPGVPRRWAVLARRYCEFVAKSAQVWAVTRARVRWARLGRLLRRARWAIRYREENFVPRFVLTFVKRWKAL